MAADDAQAPCRWMAWCAYEGTEFNGWQSQPGGGAVQDVLEARLAEIFGKPVRIHGAGRTDAGVHACAQVFHFDAAWGHETRKLSRALNVRLPGGVLIRRVRRAPEKFHARFSATAKRYVYRWHEGEAPPWERRLVRSLGHRRLDADAMHRAAQTLLGRHDFSSFGANRGDGSTDNSVKTLHVMEVRREGRRLAFTTIGSGYLFKMVRSLAGILERVGEGKMSVCDVAAILESRKRTHVVETAPAHGLWLERVYYRSSKFAGNRGVSDIFSVAKDERR